MFGAYMASMFLVAPLNFLCSLLLTAEFCPADLTVIQVNAEFQCITTLQLETTFAAQLDRITPQLMTVFQKKGGVSGQKLAHHLQIMQEAESDVKVKREAVLRALCLYLGEEDGSLIQEYLDIEGDDIQRDLKKHTMGIYVINKEDGQNGHYDDIGIFVEGEIVIDNIGSPAQACALILGVIYALNLAYPKDLKDYYEFIQKVLMGLDREKLSPKVLGLKNKIATG